MGVLSALDTALFLQVESSIINSARSQDFTEEDVSMSRVSAVINEPPFMADVYFKSECIRPMPKYCVP